MTIAFQRYNGSEWVTETESSTGGVTNHASLTNLDFELSGHTGNITTDGFVTGKKIGVFASIAPESGTVTTITVAGTYYPIEGTFTNSPVEGFSGGTVYAPSIKYDGALTQYFEIDWHATVISDSNGATIHVGIKKNGTLLTASIMGTYMKFAGEVQTLSGTTVVELSTDDEIQLVTTSDGNGDETEFDHFTTTMTEFFD